ncbi:hypothetical protein BRYFOR_06796 [Marvinbryantia formatexigens DSM 14469]|uniref:histidine kinase n=1 Tax=Marvinbryantia formatexigens DSM 14469 TaxID=478749 RepID=C6LDU7_9FIRM|nr:HAMP domain-containing sensor histidine kinase [Marvinbryantia formatexigens]EET61151.1 hypothetical protein BRYFOR_06796 [Marvinbryantia formatexigens DSM 14469]UWO23723.1 HAMP domain-containing histidine kinase [Marvinbryantia formatexigens DSM 14469]SDF67938.1 Signal transduction histidine kinase [Marvinbryantia formatexigens]
MSFLEDRQVKRYWYFLLLFLLLLFLTGALGVQLQSRGMQKVMLSHDNAVATALLDKGVSRTVIAEALASTEERADGAEFLAVIGRTEQTAAGLFPLNSRFRQKMTLGLLVLAGLLSAVLLAGSFLFFWRRERLYREAADIIADFADGNYVRHLPQSSEGELYRVFAGIDRLATMLRSENETQRRTKEFLRNTISDISHQLKTPLAALAMYQEIIEEEPEHTGVVKEFAAKMRAPLERMERLISSMLKITRLDAGCIVFEKKPYQVSEILWRAVGEFSERAKKEEKEILLEGALEDTLFCDLEWTAEAVGNIVKNALDHTAADGKIRIAYERSSCMANIVISDNGPGILPEDIHHIFKRFYRSKNSGDTQGAGLGLPLAKAIIEGQGGTISVKSGAGEGTSFTISLLTKL